MAGTFGHASINASVIESAQPYAGSVPFIMRFNNSENRWTKLHDRDIHDSIITPFVAPVDSEIISATLTQNATNADPIMRFFVDETLITTWTPPNNIKHAWNIENSPFPITLNQGQRLAIFMANNSNTGRGVITVYIRPVPPIDTGTGETINF